MTKNEKYIDLFLQSDLTCIRVFANQIENKIKFVSHINTNKIYSNEKANETTPFKDVQIPVI